MRGPVEAIIDITDYERPIRLASSTPLAAMDIYSTLTFEPIFETTGLYRDLGHPTPRAAHSDDVDHRRLRTTQGSRCLGEPPNAHSNRRTTTPPGRARNQ
jgi:hypothetical protein